MWFVCGAVYGLGVVLYVVRVWCCVWSRCGLVCGSCVVLCMV